MADLDMLLDALGSIVNHIIDEITQILAFVPNEYNWPNWVQATMIFGKAVAPCDNIYYYDERLYNI
ncbi:MAG: hypothetical protein GF317_14610 [Candidatus Lokiarchaeota archaeon]|nr:hypothetical protein [Candidatus Lokiarchaeota archaeon]MBD3200839.1 hypothetical protein [Candidatus Lokiarchaeota archaeon]